MRISILVFAVLITGTCRVQSFEGKITYQNIYKIKLPNVSSEQFTSMIGNASGNLAEGTYKWNGISWVRQ